MNRVFIMTLCKYPHGGALANYVQNLAKAILDVGYEVILATNINQEYSICNIVQLSKPISVIPIMPSEDSIERQRQKETGYSKEWLDILEKYEIDKTDKVMVLGLRSVYFLDRLFEYGKEIGFRIICGVLELFKAEDFSEKEEYDRYIYIVGAVYLHADAILSISEYIDRYFMNKGMTVFRLSPMIDSREYEVKSKETDKYRFIIPSQKDSFIAVLRAFEGLTDEELDRIEIHLCGFKKAFLNEIMSLSEWERLKKYIVVHPWLKYEELIGVYQKVHFLLIARKKCQRTLANFPSKVPETMAYGVVPIVSDVGDYTKYFLQNEKDSIFIKGDSVDETRKAIRKAINMNKKEYGCYSTNAYKTAKERFDYRVWKSQVKRMLESV